MKREIFAAGFRDRIVHHLIVNKINHLFERQFIHDSYACRVGKGSHLGIKRVDRFIRRETLNYARNAWILKLDIRGFFMSIDQNLLFANFYLDPMAHFIKHNLGFRSYGRYVDDFIIVHPDRDTLRDAITVIRNFLLEDLKLILHPGKIYLEPAHRGVQFLGAVIKHNYILVTSRVKGNFYSPFHTVKSEKY